MPGPAIIRCAIWVARSLLSEVSVWPEDSALCRSPTLIPRAFAAASIPALRIPWPWCVPAAVPWICCAAYAAPLSML